MADIKISAVGVTISGTATHILMVVPSMGSSVRKGDRPRACSDDLDSIDDSVNE